ncbi:trypsin-like serine protease [Shewanella colwelliana]|uniref:trypsin-like serine protease n=1 Tax=Shewanella colwelliana TaxID=23 RepID=UPI003734DEE2
MKKTLLALSLLGLSGNAFAIEGGTPLNWSEHNDMVHMSCTGTIISGKWVLTAAHCEPSASKGVKTQHNGTLSPQVYNHPEYMSDGIDIALWELPTLTNTTLTTFLSMRNVETSEEIKISGFGQTAPDLNYAIQTSTPQLVINGEPLSRIDLKVNNLGTTLPGDSGAPYTDLNNSIIGIHNGGAFDAETGKQAQGTRLTFARDFILTTINGWHYPTQATTPTNGGTVTVEVQSLHQASFHDNATYSGDVTVTGGSCLSETVEPFETCTYEIESANGYEGKVTLDEGQIITINRGRTKPVEPPKPDTGGSSSGGSLGFLSLLGLLGLRFTRAFWSKARA